MPPGQNEAFSRVLIDKALEYSDWNLLDPRQVQFESHTSNGRADYLLKDSLGRVLCVLEAKRENLDPYDAKEQARGYSYMSPLKSWPSWADRSNSWIPWMTARSVGRS
jgi:predicted type IV restriction endonuclease